MVSDYGKNSTVQVILRDGFLDEEAVVERSEIVDLLQDYMSRGYYFLTVVGSGRVYLFNSRDRKKTSAR